jgi:endonuclease/exonuclease/phosphatase family metal-dependent hydrolase
MKLITWNIQWGLGMDGLVDLPRIVNVARDMADFDVLCLQEITDNYPALAGNDGSNQFDTLRGLLPGYSGIDGVAVDRYTPDVGRQRFGNMIFSRLPVVQVLRHQLPWPAEPTLPTMPRMALEVVVQAADGPIRITTTHLEVYSARQRLAQAELLRSIHADACSHAADQIQTHKIGSPFETRPRATRAVLTGDFNCTADDPAIEALERADSAVPRYVDAWSLTRPGESHGATVGLHTPGAEQRCLDYIFVSEDFASAVRSLSVQTETHASDHQPLLLETNP